MDKDSRGAEIGFLARWDEGGAPTASLLLQYLCDFQHRDSYISPEAVSRLAGELGIPRPRIQGVVEFYSFLHTVPRGAFDILISDSITDQMRGSRELTRQLSQRLDVRPGEPRSDGRVTLGFTSCTGMCDQGPAMLVNGVPLTHLSAQRVTLLAELVEEGKPFTEWPSDWFRVEDNIRRKDILLAAETACGGALQELLKKGSAIQLQGIEESGLRGRGGAGFSTAAKWRSCRDAPGDARYVVCNADEGEPGTFKDRVLLQSYADDVFEGMTLCAGIVGASKGFLYLRGEYRYLLPHLQQVLQQRRDHGLLGSGILGRDGIVAKTSYGRRDQYLVVHIF